MCKHALRMYESKFWRPLGNCCRMQANSRIVFGHWEAMFEDIALPGCVDGVKMVAGLGICAECTDTGDAGVGASENELCVGAADGNSVCVCADPCEELPTAGREKEIEACSSD